MKILKYRSSFGQSKMKLTWGEVLDAPHFKNYIYVVVNQQTPKTTIDFYIQNGFIYTTDDDYLLSSSNINTLHIVSKEEIALRSKTKGYWQLWRPVNKYDILSIFELRQYIMVKGIKVHSAKLLESDMIEFIDTQYHESLGDYVDKRQTDRDFFSFTHRFSQHDIDQICLEVIHFDLSKFGETKYLDESHKETFVLDMHHPDMNIYEQIKSYGLLEIDWQG